MNEVRLPDIEVVIRAASFDVGVITMFMGGSPHDPVEVVTAVQEPAEVSALCEALQTAINALRSSSWFSLDELDVGTAEDENKPPF